MKPLAPIFNSVKLIILFIFILYVSEAFAKILPLEKQYYRFDAGAKDSPVQQDAILLTPEATYNSGKKNGCSPNQIIHSFVASWSDPVQHLPSMV